MKRVLCRVWLLFALAIVAVACGGKEPESKVQLSVAQLEFAENAAQLEFDIATQEEWSITSPEWVVCTPSKGVGSAVVGVAVEANTGAERAGDVVVSAGGEKTSLRITQKSPSFAIDEPNILFGVDGTPRQIYITSDYDWNIEVPPSASWCNISPQRGTPGTTKVTLSPAESSVRVPRDEVVLKVVYNGTEADIVISQAILNSDPSVPVLLSPSQNQTEVEQDPIFEWEASEDHEGDVLSYELSISDDNGQTWQNFTTTETSFKSGVVMQTDMQYQWRVAAKDIFGGQAQSDIWRFTTVTSPAKYADGEVTLRQAESAGASKPVHLIIIGDGYVESDYEIGGKYDEDVQRAIDGFFVAEPYTTYRNYFRISSVAAYSNESGASVTSRMTTQDGQTIAAGTVKDTKFSSQLAGGNSTGVSSNYDLVYEYARKVSGVTDTELRETTILLMINLNVYAGTCLMEYTGRSVSMCPVGDRSFEAIVLHEGGGHGFGRLLDEYRYYREDLPASEAQGLEGWRRGDPYFGNNISLTDDRAQTHWKHYFDIAGYDAVGLYEGAYLYYTNVWRPEFISCMEDNRFYFNAPSREAIVRRVMKSAGETFSMDDFIAKDNQRMDPTAAMQAPGVGVVDFVPLGNPIMVDK